MCEDARTSDTWLDAEAIKVLAWMFGAPGVIFFYHRKDREGREGMAVASAWYFRARDAKAHRCLLGAGDIPARGLLKLTCVDRNHWVCVRAPTHREFGGAAPPIVLPIAAELNRECFDQMYTFPAALEIYEGSNNDISESSAPRDGDSAWAGLSDLFEEEPTPVVREANWSAALGAPNSIAALGAGAAPSMAKVGAGAAISTTKRKKAARKEVTAAAPTESSSEAFKRQVRQNDESAENEADDAFLKFRLAHPQYMVRMPLNSFTLDQLYTAHESNRPNDNLLVRSPPYQSEVVRLYLNMTNACYGAYMLMIDHGWRGDATPTLPQLSRDLLARRAVRLDGHEKVLAMLRRLKPDPGARDNVRHIAGEIEKWLSEHMEFSFDLVASTAIRLCSQKKRKL